MLTKPYIGITGVKSYEECAQLARLAKTLGLPETHQLMLGLLASYKGLTTGVVADPAKYPSPDMLNEIFVADSKVLNIVHYNSRAEGLDLQIMDLMHHARLADGVQLNIVWPDPCVLRRLRERRYLVVIQQISAHASRQLGDDPVRVVERLADYAGLIEYVLIDPSGGMGQTFDLDYATGILEAMVASGLPMRWGIAGGMGPGALGNLEPLLEIYPDLMWDAEGRLRTPDGNRLDLAACEQYLLEGVALLHKLPGRGSTVGP